MTKEVQFARLFGLWGLRILWSVVILYLLFVIGSDWISAGQFTWLNLVGLVIAIGTYVLAQKEDLRTGLFAIYGIVSIVAIVLSVVFLISEDQQHWVATLLTMFVSGFTTILVVIANRRI